MVQNAYASPCLAEISAASSSSQRQLQQKLKLRRMSNEAEELQTNRRSIHFFPQAMTIWEFKVNRRRSPAMANARKSDESGGRPLKIVVI